MTVTGAVQMASDSQPTSVGPGVFAIVAAHNEADRIVATLAALAEAFPGVPVWVADDGSTDATAALAEAHGAHVVRSERGAPRRRSAVGKGGAVTLTVREALGEIRGEESLRGEALGEIRGEESLRGEALGEIRGEESLRAGAAAPRTRIGDSSGEEPIAVLCDGDLGDSAACLGALVEAVRGGEADLAVAAFVRRVGGGVGLAVGFAGWAIRRRCGLLLEAPISGQRAMRATVLEQVLPLAPGFGMEIGMTIDAARAGARVRELDLDLAHRATGRTLGGFLHRGRQLIDFVRVYLSRR